MRTSDTHPLQVGEIPLLNGKIGLTFCPGKKQPTSLTGGWYRDVATDLAVVKGLGYDTVVSLLESHEYRELGVSLELPLALMRDFSWHPMPIPDKGAPDNLFVKDWQKLSPQLLERLEHGSGVLVHCKGGFGRTGTVAAMLLIDSGVHVSEALQAVRAARDGAVENTVQEVFLNNYAIYRGVK